MSRVRFCITAAASALIAGLLASSELAAWEAYGADPGGSKFSALTQIDTVNVTTLERAWTFQTGETGEGYASGRNLTFQATPIFWNDTLYFNSSFGKAYAVEAATGKLIWQFDTELSREERFDESAARGVSIWHDTNQNGQTCAHRILFGTLEGQLYAIDAMTGQRCTDFGTNGQVDLTQGVGPVEFGSYTVTSPPTILGDTLFVGSAIGDNRKIDSERGIVRAIDIKSGAVKWSWDPVPRNADDPARQSWGGDSADVSGGANAWAPLSVDADLNLVFVPTSAASPDFYGGHRAGNNLYTNSVVALAAESGRLVWHRQLVHHDVWDYDTPAQPVLVDIDLGEGPVAALVQVTKTGMMYVLDRATGEPLIPIEERAVPQEGVPGEHLAATQPFSTLPPIARHSGVSTDDAFGILLFDKWACEETLETFRSDGIFTPPTLEGTIMTPGYAGGANWGGVAVDAGNGIAVSFVNELPMLVRLVEREKFDWEDHPGFDGSRMGGTPYIMVRRPFLSPLDLPCTQPPWGRVVAMDLKNRTIAWSQPIGTTADLAPAFVPNFDWGMPGMGGPLITASGIVFIGAVAEHQFRALDLATGEELWRGELPRAGMASPMTYEVDGKQFVVIAAGGHAQLIDTGDFLVAFALP